VILLNRCHNIKIHSREEPPTVYAESGANLSNIARMTALRGLAGLEWAGSVPGSVGGAIYGNAGAFGSDISQCLLTVQVLTPEQGEISLDAAQMQFSYRSSRLIRQKRPVIILTALLNALHSTREAAWMILSDNAEQRRQTQPPGNSTGSTFKNPPGDYAGRLIEAVGLKGYKAEHAQFSPVHANFIVNDGQSSAQEYLSLIRLAQRRVKEQFGIDLELEIELLGDFDDEH
jgi:UDP-N-acetylmuramate dehydrogenase